LYCSRTPEKQRNACIIGLNRINKMFDLSFPDERQLIKKESILIIKDNTINMLDLPYSLRYAVAGKF